MTLQRQEIHIKTADGTANAFTYRPGEGARSAVILYFDAFGIRPSMHAMAERLAKLGYFVMLPNLFYRSGNVSFDAATAFNNPTEREKLMSLIYSLTPERVEADSAVYLDALAAQPNVRKDRIGITGYCMGGRLAFMTAAMHGAKVRAAASFHGGHIVTDGADSPHRLADKIKASIYLGVADNDPSCTPEHQGELAKALGAAHVQYQLELYTQKKHGFAVSDHGVYDQEAAERHWRRLESFFGETLA